MKQDTAWVARQHWQVCNQIEEPAAMPSESTVYISLELRACEETNESS